MHYSNLPCTLRKARIRRFYASRRPPPAPKNIVLMRRSVFVPTRKKAPPQGGGLRKRRGVVTVNDKQIYRLVPVALPFNNSQSNRAPPSGKRKLNCNTVSSTTILHSVSHYYFHTFTFSNTYKYARGFSERTLSASARTTFSSLKSTQEPWSSVRMCAT